MKKFLIKILLFALLIFLIGLVFWIKNENRLYANPYLNEKLNFLEEHPQFNTVFIGSSKVNNQINPAVIDSINPGMKSYNLGANGSFNLENFATINHLLDKDDIPIKTIILELQNKIDFTTTNVGSERSYSVVTPDNFNFLMHYHLENRDFKQIVFSFYSALLNIFKFKRETTNHQLEQIHFIRKNGFVPLEKDQNPAVKKRHRDLLQHPKEIEKRLVAFENDQKQYKINLVFASHLQEINQKAKIKGVRFMLLIPAPAEPDAKELLAYQNLKKIDVLNFLDTKKYPEFYQLENRWDYGHLNGRGAKTLSERIGIELKKLNY